MKLTTIDGLPLIVTRAGRRELIHTPAEAKAAAHERIAEAGRAIEALQRDSAAAQHRLEAAILAGTGTGEARTELAAIHDVIEARSADQREAQADLSKLDRLLTDHHARQIEDADAARLAGLLAPFDIEAMKEIHP